MRRRRAFSLVEIILVLVLLVIVAAIAVPYTDLLFREAKPRAAADAVRAALLHARTRATEEGRNYRFGIIPGGVAFRVAPDDDGYWVGSGEGLPVPDGVTAPLILAKNLPAGVRFGTGSGAPAVPTLTGTPAAAAKKEPDPRTIDAAQFQSVVVFFSDGTAETDVEITFKTTGVPALVLSLRGLTGVSTVRTESPQGVKKP